MAKTYKQYCPMSYALDVVGDRWTMHIVRDLLFGPLRFKDLQQGLPGLASNLLTKRLKEMTAAGLIEKQALPPPASVNVYSLTARGRELQPVVSALTQFGLDYLQPMPAEEDFIGPVPLSGFLHKFFNPEKAEGLEFVGQFSTPDFTLVVEVAEQKMRVVRGSTSQAAVIITLDSPRTLVGVLNRALMLDEVVADGRIVLEPAAQRPQLAAFVAAYRPVKEGST